MLLWQTVDWTAGFWCLPGDRVSGPSAEARKDTQIVYSAGVRTTKRWIRMSYTGMVPSQKSALSRWRPYD